MIGLIQRVKHAKVEVDQQIVGEIQQGMMLLLGVEKDDTPELAEKLCDRILRYRIFNDDGGKMNLNVQQVGGELLVVSQFTLVADTSRGNRPGFSRGASPTHGKAMYEHFIAHAKLSGINCESGQFGEDMQVSLLNDGPVTFQLQV